MTSITRRRANAVWRAVSIPLVLMLGAQAGAFEPASFPDAVSATFDDRQDFGSLAVPVAVHGEEDPVIVVEGALRRRAWLVPSPSLPTLKIIQDLRGDLAAAGYEVLLDCAAEVCGGFDFRFGLPVLPAPVMNVDLFDYRVLTAVKQIGVQKEYVFLLVSRGRSNRYVQLFEIVTEAGTGTVSTRPEAPQPQAQVPTAPSIAATDNAMQSRLMTMGHVVLADLEFATGADALSERDYTSLASLADFLAQNPTSRVALVGHTDSVGSLEANTALSKRRAEAVRQRLIGSYGILESQITAEGAGFLSPIRSNTTAEGREANRRVEAVLLSLE